MNWNSGAGRSLILVVLFVVGAAFVTHRARQFASAAPNERTTTADVFSVHHNIFRALRFNYYSCNYTFIVDGYSHLGLSDCPQEIIEDAIKRKQSGSLDASAGTHATVYYDPANPLLNSLLEFSSASKNDYRIATPWIGGLVLTILFFVFGRLLTANEKRANGRVVVDTSGTSIYPDEIHTGSEFTEIANGIGAASVTQPGLRELYLELANKIHPDRAANEVDRALRERLMKEANAAFQRNDIETLRSVLEDYTSATPAS